MSLVKVDGRSTHPAPNGTTSTPEWGGFTRGDKVKIHGHRGSWTFYEYTTTDHGEEWVTVYGGDSNPLGNRQFTSVYPEQMRRAR